MKTWPTGAWRTLRPRASACVWLAVFCAGCGSTTTFDRDFVSSELETRVGAALPLETIGTEVQLPPGVLLTDGLGEEESVAIALWNNASFHAELAELGVAKADLLEAGLLPNPVLSLVFPGNSKAREGTLSVPIQLLQRPTRIAIAELNAERIAQGLLETGLGLTRDVRIAYAQLDFAETREALAERDATLAAEVAEIAGGQRDAGQISEVEVSRIEAESLAAMAAFQDAVRQSAAARHRLLGLLGFAESSGLALVPQATGSDAPPPPLPALLDVALASRPDLRAAELTVEAAAESARWERQQTYDFLALLDIDEEEGGPLDTGPGFEFELPLFDRNQGGRERAAARLEQAGLRYTAVRRSIVLDVTEHYAAHASAREAASAWREGIVPRLEETHEDTKRALSLGSVSELTVLQAEQRLLGAQLASAEAQLELKRASAELAHSVGQKADSPSQE
jgi:cobalt-zinc-cadmium efflux system outer membrane protein